MAAAQTASAPVVIVPEEVELGSSNTVWRRFRRHRLALVGLAVLAVFCFAALFAEWVALKSPYYVDIDNIKAPPAAVGGQIPARAVATMGHAAGMLELLTLLLGVVPAALRSRRALVLENLLLRHQLAALTRPARKRPAIRRRDRLVWILARRLCHDWRRSLVVVRPETVVAWH